MQQRAQTTVTIMVPTYRRPSELEKCLLAIEKQTRAPDEVVIVHRASGDPTTAALAEQWSRQGHVFRCKVAQVAKGGVIAAMDAGVRVAQGDVVAVVDDDVALHPDWLERCLPYYDNPDVAGVGGRDVIAGEQARGGTGNVGRLTWYGRMQGGHHLGTGTARAVDILKGANMSLRREYWALDRHLRGAGAQVHWEAQVCLRARRAGGMLIYDPGCLADHNPAPRFDADQRQQAAARAVIDLCHNEAYIVLTHIGWWQRPAYCFYTFLVGHRGSWGLARWVVARVAGERLALAQTLAPSYAGKALGVLSWARQALSHKKS